jgi:hypothetical protein
MRTFAPVLCLLALSGACSDEPSDDTPAGALTLFLEAMEKSDWDASARRDAYELLCSDARTALDERAERANALSRREFEPWEMLAQGRFRLRFAPAETEVRQDGDEATVTVLGRREGERADVPMVREDGHWRVQLVIPEPSSD